MPLRITSAPVAGVQKRKSKQPRQPRSSLFASHARSKPNTRKANNDKSKSNDGPVIDEPDQYYDDSDVEPLPDLGSAARYIADARPDNVRGVVDAIQHIKTTMFEELPTERAGMNSTRIAQVLNLRRALPPIVSVAHVHTVLQSPTEVEREIVALAQSGRVRRLIVPGRGRDTAALGDCLVLSEDFAELVRGSDLDSALKDRFLHTLDEMQNTATISALTFPAEDAMKLVRAGFLVTASSIAQGLNTSTRTGTSDNNNNSNNDSTDESSSSTKRDLGGSPSYLLSLPNIGTYLRLLAAGRTHLLNLLKKRSKYQEAPLSLLRDQWDGAVENRDRSYMTGKRLRGEGYGVLPGRTKKWKDLYGMRFGWILGEAMGAGLVELFETGSVGPGVRCLG